MLNTADYASFHVDGKNQYLVIIIVKSYVNLLATREIFLRDFLVILKENFEYMFPLYEVKMIDSISQLPVSKGY